MVYSQAPIDIAKGAIKEIGISKSISSLEDPNSSEEIMCAEEIDDSRRETLQLHIWNFAKTRKKITAETTSPAFGFNNKYALPSDFVRVVQVGSGISDVLYTRYAIENGYLLLGYSPDDSSSSTTPSVLNLVYIKDETNLTIWSPLAIRLYKLVLASKLFPLHKSKTLQDRIENRIATLIPTALSKDGQDQPPVRIERSKILEARTLGSLRNNKYVDSYFYGH